MNIKETIQSQYLAALEMLRQAIVHCPELLWNHPDHKNKFWHTAYHALFYTHLYLQPTEENFKPWEKHAQQWISLGEEIPPAERESEHPVPYRKDELLVYLEICQKEVGKQVAALDLEAESGFYWLPFKKLELQFYNIRHIQHHAGELYNRLQEQEGVELKWIGRKPAGILAD